jgi:uncharacterized membrane protein YoaK (UPF0700 family)
MASGNQAAQKITPYVFLGMTVVTGLVDAVSFLSLGRVFTANMTGNIVLLGFATARVPGLSVTRSLTALASFLAGAVLGGRIMAEASGDSQFRFAARAFLLELVVLTAASVCAIGYKGGVVEPSVQPLALIALTGLAMGARNAAVRKLAIPDLTTTVLTMTLTGIAADSPLAHGSNVRLARRMGSVVAICAGAALGAVVIRYSVAVALALAAAISALCNAAFFRALRAPDAP